MARRIRKQVSITPEQDETLRRLADETGLSQSGIVRMAITSYLSGPVFLQRDLAA